MTTSHLRAWAEIDLEALRHNARVAREFSGGPIMAIVKADAYGHGLAPVVRALADLADWFGVANVQEALAVRTATDRGRVFLLGPTLPMEREIAVANGFTPSVSNLEEARAFDALASRLAEPFPLHLVIDTGMGRIGCLEAEFAALVEGVRKLRHVWIEGVATHFASADEDPAFTQRQIEEAQRLVAAMQPVPPMIHLSSSTGVLGYPPAQHLGTLSRPGLMLYGVSPLPDDQPRLRPAMTLRARVSLVRDVPAGRGISYGRTFITERPSRIATLSIGYGDGYPRHVSNRGAQVLIGGRRCPIRGRVTMDQILVDVTELPTPPAPGNEVVLLGRQGDEEIGAMELAQWAQTIPWEIFTSFTPRCSRVYLE